MSQFKGKLLGTYDDLLEMYHGLEESDMNKIKTVCKRSLGQMTYHFAYFESMYFTKLLRLFLYNNEQSVKSFQDIDLSELSFTLQEVDNWLCFFNKERMMNVYILDSLYEFLKCKELNHEVHGKLSVEKIIETVLSHDLRHCQQVRDLISCIKGSC